ncbi:hypothetical protein QBC42DRAFT_264910 [Cladorrhinum samala]|uniref:Uncharacterized protein n=1 Tax=Cladorrhinum samala TaxID=585594 RepID=A0AAV9HWG2_9PEZI|nr:hypothetical protein QBC42DRAFT_264910 [Cladorrhinum samala]
MATQTTDHFPLATEVYTGTDFDQDDGSSAGAAGPSTGGITISRGALIAIVVVVVVVAIVGIASSVLFFVAKKREWTVKETIRRSARKVVTALTPRRSEFPRSVKESRGGRVKLDEVPPTPRIPEHLDLEKGVARSKSGKKNYSRK